MLSTLIARGANLNYENTVGSGCVLLEYRAVFGMHADGILEWCKYLNNLKLFICYQVEHETPLMRAIRKDNEFAVDELIKASAKQNYLDSENKVKPYGEFTVEI